MQETEEGRPLQISARLRQSGGNVAPGAGHSGAGESGVVLPALLL